MTTADNESLLVELVARALDTRDAGQRLDLATLCAGQPGLVEDVRRALAAHDAWGRAASDPQLGRRLAARYRLVRRIGMGAMGTVFAAFDETLQRHVAVKILDPRMLDDDKRRARFRREAQAIAVLREPGIVTVHDHGYADATPFVVMDLVPGLDLEALAGADATMLRGLEAWVAAERAASPRVFHDAELQVVPDAFAGSWPHLAARTVLDVARALAHAHAHGVLHRDVKPSNILVRPDGRAVLLDFGLARLPGAETLTRAGEMLGTLAYMAPEQVRATSEIDARADVYSLGASLYRLLAGRPPFVGDPESVVKQVLFEDPVPLRRLGRDLPRDLTSVCHKAIEKRPADRYSDASAFGADLAAFLDHRAIVASSPGWPQRVLRRVRRRPERAVAVTLVLVVLPLGWIAWSGVEARAAQRARTAAHVARGGVPALVTIEGRNPAYSWSGAERVDQTDFARARLDEVLAADPADVEALLLRAMLELDAGRVERARDDLATLARDHPSSEVLARVRRRLDRVGAASELRTADLADVSDPATAFDCFLLAIQSLRSVRYPQALRLLDRALELDGGFFPALHLRPLALLGVGEFAVALDAAHRAEGALGRHTARTRYAAAVAEMQLGRMDAAIASFSESLELCPDQYGALHNLAVLFQRKLRPEVALRHVQRAAAVRPDAVPSWRTHLQLLAELGRDADFDRLAAEVRDRDGGSSPWWLDLELGQREYLHATASLGARPHDAREACLRAVALFDEALPAMTALGLDREAGQIRVHREIARLLAGSDNASAVQLLLRAIGDAAPDPTQQRDVAQILRTDPALSGMALYFARQANRLSPDDASIAAVLIDCLLDEGSPDMLVRAVDLWRRHRGGHPGAETVDKRDRILAAVHRAFRGADAAELERRLLDAAADPTPGSQGR